LKEALEHVVITRADPYRFRQHLGGKPMNTQQPALVLAGEPYMAHGDSRLRGFKPPNVSLTKCLAYQQNLAALSELFEARSEIAFFEFESSQPSHGVRSRAPLRADVKSRRHHRRLLA
jgi:hypothetical protein